jgi:SAM-dependent methyltransferase
LPAFILKYVKPGQRVLEAGCGLGRLVAYLSRRGIAIDAADYSHQALRGLKGRLPDSRVVSADVRALPYQAGTFDVCLSLGVLEHNEEGPSQGLREAWRVLKPEGILVITGPCYEINGYRRYRQCRERLLSTPRRLLHGEALSAAKRLGEFFEYHFSVREMKRHLQDARFSVVETGYYGTNAGLWSYFPTLRHPSTATGRGYYEVARDPKLTDHFTWAGQVVRRFASVAWPSLFAFSWMFAARKTG